MPDILSVSTLSSKSFERLSTDRCTSPISFDRLSSLAVKSELIFPTSADKPRILPKESELAVLSSTKSVEISSILLFVLALTVDKLTL